MKAKTNSAIHQPSDKLFKIAMGNLELARECIQTHLPADIVQKLDLSTLKAQNNSFISETYKTKWNAVKCRLKH